MIPHSLKTLTVVLAAASTFCLGGIATAQATSPMASDKMAADKMGSGDKMASDKMASDKMAAPHKMKAHKKHKMAKKSDHAMGAMTSDGAMSPEKK